jgi:hypothetical protein
MTAGPVIDAYLREVTAALPGSARARRDITAELHSGLFDALDAHRRAGLPGTEAEAAAVAEFGDPRQLAAAFRPELAARQARRVALTLVTTGPLIGLLWAGAALASHIRIRHAPPWQWAGTPPAAPAAFPLAAGALLIAVWAALVTMAATGPLTRWIPDGPRLAATTAAISGSAAITADIAVFTLLASQLISAPATLAPLPVTAAAIASLTRLTLTRGATHHCLAARASLA